MGEIWREGKKREERRFPGRPEHVVISNERRVIENRKIRDRCWKVEVFHKKMEKGLEKELKDRARLLQGHMRQVLVGGIRKPGERGSKG